MESFDWSTLRRPLPAWFADATLGVFLHWGAYSVPAWAEPSGALGEMDDVEFLRRNPYAEWYFNTVRIDGSSAARHHRDVHGDAPYDDFLDRWTAARFDPDDWARLFAAMGADYVIPTTKHHDGITLWDAPGTGARNTVHRGPRRDLVDDLAHAVRDHGMRFGLYYSGGQDWSLDRFPALRSFAQVAQDRPQDAAYNLYALAHVRDLIRRHAPDVLWNDMDWPAAGKRDGRDGLVDLFREYYAAVPEGVVNDRWGVPHHDFRTTEYSSGGEHEESGDPWEHTRGLGFSFGYNREEGADVTLDGAGLARHWVDVVARGGRLLIDIGPTAEGLIPPLQRVALEGFAAWRRRIGDAGSRIVRDGGEVVDVGEGSWVRMWRTADGILLFWDSAQELTIPRPADAGDAIEVLGGSPARLHDGGIALSATAHGDGPSVARLVRRT